AALQGAGWRMAGGNRWRKGPGSKETMIGTSANLQQTGGGARGGLLSSFMFQGILPIDKSRLPADIMAGVTLATLGIPAAMGYTKTRGSPGVAGLSSSLLQTRVFALFGSSGPLGVGGNPPPPPIVAAKLTPLPFPANTPRYIALTSLVALVTAGLL